MFLLFVEMFSFDVFTSGIDVETDFAEISKSFSNSFWEILSKLEVISIEDSVLLFIFKIVSFSIELSFCSNFSSSLSLLIIFASSKVNFLNIGEIFEKIDFFIFEKGEILLDEFILGIELSKNFPTTDSATFLKEDSLEISSSLRLSFSALMIFSISVIPSFSSCISLEILSITISSFWATSVFVSSSCFSIFSFITSSSETSFCGSSTNSFVIVSSCTSTSFDSSWDSSISLLLSSSTDVIFILNFSKTEGS